MLVFFKEKNRVHGNKLFQRFITKMTIKLYGHLKLRETIPLYIDLLFSYGT